MNIAFLTSGHIPFDDRIFYHFGRSFCDHNQNVRIISSKYFLNTSSGGISLNCFEGDELTKSDKINQFKERLSEFQPDLIICSEPLPVLAARHYSKKQKKQAKIIYDITEWYPSGKNLGNYKSISKWYHFTRLLLFNIYVSLLTDYFIFGEYYKSRPYRFLFPRKPFSIITYYPDLKYIPYCNPDLQKGKLRLSYSGRISSEKGYGNFISVLDTLKTRFVSLKIEVKIIGWYESPASKKEFEQILSNTGENITIRIYERQSFKDFLDLISDSDIFLDLRTIDLENNHSLPIKLFYYAALGRPVIYSNLKSIRKEVDIDKFGFLVNPECSDEIAEIISEYLSNNDLYFQHCRNARSIATDRYNWKIIEPKLINLISRKQESET